MKILYFFSGLRLLNNCQAKKNGLNQSKLLADWQFIKIPQLYFYLMFHIILATANIAKTLAISENRKMC